MAARMPGLQEGYSSQSFVTFLTNFCYNYRVLLSWWTVQLSGARSERFFGESELGPGKNEFLGAL